MYVTILEKNNIPFLKNVDVNIQAVTEFCIALSSTFSVITFLNFQ